MKCAIYVRVSTNKEEQKQSLENQKDLFKRLLKEKNWDLFDFYVDIQSGTTAKRKNLQRLIKDAEDNKFDIILAKELSRLARNGALAYKIRDIAQQNNIQIMTLDNSINTLENYTDNFGLFAWLYEKESENTSKRLKAAFKSRANNGFFKGSIPPYGYYCNNGKLIIRNDNTPNIVKRIFDEYLSGNGFDAIARKLYEEDIPTPSIVGRKSKFNNIWHGSAVRNILENPHYTGDLVQNRTTTLSAVSKKRILNNKKDYIIIKDTHEAIISREKFDAVQSLISQRKRKRPQQNIHLFSNMLYCHDCGHGMHYKKNRRGYICGSYNKHGKKACSDHIIREETLKQLILDDLRAMTRKLNKKDYIDKIKDKLSTIKSQSQKDIDKYSFKISQLKDRKSIALDKFIQNIITKEDYDFFINKTNKQMEALEELKNSIKENLENTISDDYLNNLNSLLGKIININSIDRTILNILIDKIEIKEDGSPIIYYKFRELPSL